MMKPIVRGLGLVRLLSCAALFVSLLMSPTSLTAEEAKPTSAISLPEALKITVRQSPALKLASINVKIAEASVEEAEGVNDWVLGATGSGSISRQAVPSLTFGLTESNQASFATFLSKSLSGGGSLQVTATGQYQRSESQGVTTIQDPNDPTQEIPVDISTPRRTFSSVISAEVSQPLLQGAGSDAARTILKQARISRQVADLQAQTSAITTVRDVIIAYWELAYAIQSLDITRNTLALSKKQLELVNKQISAGSAGKAQAYEIEQIATQRETEVLQAERLVRERSIELRRLSGLPITPSQIALQSTSTPQIRTRSPDLKRLFAQAFAESPELLALMKQKEGAKLSLRVTKKGTLPRLDVGLTGSANVTRDMLFETTITGFDVTGTLTFQRPLGNNSADGAHRRARESLHQASLTLLDVKAQVATAITQAVTALQVAQKNIELADRTIVLAEKTVEVEKTRFKASAATQFDIAQREDELKRAQLQKARATVDYLNASAQLDALTGQLLKRYGITLQKPKRR